VRRGREGEENGGSEERWRWSASGPTWRRHGVTEDLARCGRGGFLALFACAFRVSPAGAESGAASASEAEAAPAAVRMQRVECGGSSYSTLDEWISGNSLPPPPHLATWAPRVPCFRIGERGSAGDGGWFGLLEATTAGRPSPLLRLTLLTVLSLLMLFLLLFSFCCALEFLGADFVCRWCGSRGPAGDDRPLLCL
jgi:hypothetical protein